MHTGWLVLTAFWIGLTHTLLGPDHYVPFVAMSRAGKWSWRKTLTVTTLCGAGHVGSSVLLGLIGLLAGVLLERLVDLEEIRGDWAAWLLIGFGLAYMTWGVGRAIRGKQHAHLHGHADGTWHSHSHAHEADHLHVHERQAGLAATEPANTQDEEASSNGDVRRPLTPWVLFVIFFFGPCEPLIPLFIYPAAKHSFAAAAAVAGSFALATLLGMLACVVALTQLASAIKLPNLERFSHALAGMAITGCGVAVKAGL